MALLVNVMSCLSFGWCGVRSRFLPCRTLTIYSSFLILFFSFYKNQVQEDTIFNKTDRKFSNHKSWSVRSTRTFSIQVFLSRKKNCIWTNHRWSCCWVLLNQSKSASFLLVKQREISMKNGELHEASKTRSWNSTCRELDLFTSGCWLRSGIEEERAGIMRRPCSCRPATGLVWSTSRSGTGCCPALLDQSEPCLAIPMAATAFGLGSWASRMTWPTGRPVFQPPKLLLDLDRIHFFLLFCEN